MPKTVAIIGASNDRRKFGNKAVRAFEHQGYTVIPINPHEKEVEGHRAYPSVLDVPGAIDVATLYVPPEIGARIMVEVAAKEIPLVWLNPGADGHEVAARARELGLTVVEACSIIGIGENPGSY